MAERTNPAELERMTDYPVETVPSLDADASDGDSEPGILAAGVGDALSPAFRNRLPIEDC